MEMQFSLLEVLPLTILPSRSPTELPKTSSLQHTTTLSLRAGCCRAKPYPTPPDYFGSQGTPTPVLQTWWGRGPVWQVTAVDQWHEMAISGTRLYIQDNQGLQTSPGVTSQACHNLYIPGVTHNSAATTSSTHKPLHRITESQNSRGWKGPLWVI